MNAVPRQANYFAVVPAAGTGSRMGADCPKQYLPLGDRAVIEHTLGRLLEVPVLRAIVVAIAPDDGRWPGLALAGHDRIHAVSGGAERCHSVLNGLEYLTGRADDRDWVLVHDVARPCIAGVEIARLIDGVGDHAVGGILAIPVSDTLKKVGPAGIEATVDRTGVWRAQTPQMFRLGLLRDALQMALQRGGAITDEASAIELAGYQPQVIEGSPTNIKITHPRDLALAGLFCGQATLEGEH